MSLQPDERIVVSKKYLESKEQMVQTLFQELRKQKKAFRELFDSIPLNYNKFSDTNYEFYDFGPKSKWITWLKKFEDSLKEVEEH